MNSKLLMVALVLPLVAGCSSFHREWKTALRQPISTNDISGPWEGRWISDNNGHNGRLRCIMTSETTNSYTAHFHATFWKIFRSAYRVPFHVEREGEKFRFSGESNLGKLAGGVYSYEGTATPATFNSAYKSKYDHGKFELGRPSAQPQ